MNTQYKQSKPTGPMAKALALGTAALLAFASSIQGQTVNGASNVDMGNSGSIRNMPHIDFPSRSNGQVTWTNQNAITFGILGQVAPVSQFIGMAQDGTNVAFADLLPIRSQSLSVVSSADVTADVVQINQDGVTTGALNLLDQTATTTDPDTSEVSPTRQELTVDNGVLQLNGEAVTAEAADALPTYGGTLNMVEVTKDDGSKILVSRTEVTYGEWLQVLRWSLNNGYNYASHSYSTAGAQLLTDMTDPARAKFVDSNNSTTPGMSQGGFDHPVTGVNYYDIAKWCNALSEMMGSETYSYVYTDAAGAVLKTGEPGRPPYDAAGNTGFRMPTPEEYVLLLKEFDTAPAGSAHLSRTPGIQTAAPVASYPVVSKDGLYDLVGNVWEMSSLDAWGNPNYWHTRIYGRGNDSTTPSDPLTYIAWRHWQRQYNVGFRLVRTLP